MKGFIFALILAQGFFAGASSDLDITIQHLQMGGSYHNFFMKSLSAKASAQGEKVSVHLLPTPYHQDRQGENPSGNPFHFTFKNWEMTDAPVNPEQPYFKELNAKHQAPNFMIISGHHIPGIGWHSDNSTPDNVWYAHSLRMSSLLRLREASPEAQAYFDNVKFVFISGCWGLANMEPHDQSGGLIGQSERLALYNSGDAGKMQVLGTPNDHYSLSAQRFELTTLYDGDFAAKEKDAVCEGQNCSTYYIQKVMPDEGLFDNSHRYNEPLGLKKLFPKAYLIFGFHSPSPYSDKVMTLLSATLARARLSPLLKPEDQVYTPNIIQSIISSQTPTESKMRLVQAFRQSWTTLTWEKNIGYMPKNYFGGRPAASISPAFPELDNDGVFAWPKDYKNVPVFAPRCWQYRSDATPCQSTLD